MSQVYYYRAIWARVAVLAIGRKQPKTLQEQKRAAWGGLRIRYRETQPRKKCPPRVLKYETRRRA